MKFSDVKGNSEIIKFRTQFVRSEYFCFEWQDYGPNRGKSESFSSIWSDPKTTYFCWHRRSLVVQEEENLQMAICGATGCSAGGAHIVPELLLEEIRTDSKHLLTLSDPVLIGVEEQENEECYAVQGSLFMPNDHIFWISKSSFALRRVRRDMSITAEESRKQHEELLSNKELMGRMAEAGIPLPSKVVYLDRNDFTDYIYGFVSFDQPIIRLPRPNGGSVDERA